jgi:predicted flap endonuclease-1-like 5' DNA nuclease
MQKFPERGDMDQPELIIFLDEAHLIFDSATKALKDQLESIIKLIRSKGVGIFFCTQNPNDIPESILSQLGLKIQHALRAFTAKDRQAIKLVAQNYPETSFYQVEDLITQLGIGEAFVTALNEKGIPTPLVHCLMTPPQSRMDILNEEEMNVLIQKSSLYKKYKATADPESAFEILSAKMEQLQQQEAEVEQAKAEAKQAKTTARTAKAEKSTLDKVLSNTVTRQIARTATTTLTRGLLGALKGMFK